MNSKSGEAMTFALIGLLIGAAMLYVNSGSTAQQMADATGKDTSQWEVISNEPGKSAATLLLPAAAGWGVGVMLDSVSGKSGGSSQDNNIRVNTDGNVNISVIGNQDNDTQMRTDTRNDTRTNQ
jgi:hypothetical protein